MNRFKALGESSTKSAFSKRPNSRDGSSPREKTFTDKSKNNNKGRSKTSNANSFRSAQPINTRFPRPSSSDSVSSILSRGSSPSPSPSNNSHRREGNTTNSFRQQNRPRNDSRRRPYRSDRRRTSPRNVERNTFNWKKKEAEEKERKRLEQLAKSEENFPTFGGSKSIETKEPATIKDNDSVKVNNYKSAMIFKRKKQVKKPNIPPGWVKLKRVNKKTKVIHGPKIVQKKRKPNIEASMTKMFDNLWESRINGWEVTGFWDSRMNELEKIIDEAEREDDDYYSEEEYYEEEYDEDVELNAHLGRSKRT